MEPSVKVLLTNTIAETMAKCDGHLLEHLPETKREWAQHAGCDRTGRPLSCAGNYLQSDYYSDAQTIVEDLSKAPLRILPASPTSGDQDV